jgi:hypothetical protein
MVSLRPKLFCEVLNSWSFSIPGALGEMLISIFQVEDRTPGKVRYGGFHCYPNLILDYSNAGEMAHHCSGGACQYAYRHTNQLIAMPYPECTCLKCTWREAPNCSVWIDSHVYMSGLGLIHLAILRWSGCTPRHQTGKLLLLLLLSLLLL